MMSKDELIAEIERLDKLLELHDGIDSPVVMPLRVHWAELKEKLERCYDLV